MNNERNQMVQQYVKNHIGLRLVYHKNDFYVVKGNVFTAFKDIFLWIIGKYEQSKDSKIKIIK